MGPPRLKHRPLCVERVSPLVVLFPVRDQRFSWAVGFGYDVAGFHVRGTETGPGLGLLRGVRPFRPVWLRAPIRSAVQEPLCVTGTLVVLPSERVQADFMLQEAAFKAESSRVAQQMPAFPELICPARLVPSPLPGAA